MANKRWDEFGADTTLDTTSIVAVETAPASTHVMKKITLLNFFKSLFKQNLWELGMAISDPPAGFIALKPDANGFFYSHDSAGTTRALTPPVVALVPVFGVGVSATTGDGKAYLVIPARCNGMNMTAVKAVVITAGTTGTMDIQIRNVTDAVDMLSTKITIDTTETSSATADVPAVIDGTKDDVVTGDVLAFDVDVVHTTPAVTCYVEVTFQYP